MVEVFVQPRRSVSFEEFCRVPGPAVALDGYVPGPPRFSAAGPHITFDHHGECHRYATRATCEQVALAIQTGLFDACRRDGAPHVDAYVNDADADVCLSVWLLCHPERVNDPDVVRLVTTEGLLDTTSGVCTAAADGATLDGLSWVFEPYWRLRDDGLPDASGAQLARVIDDVVERITAHLDGRGGRRSCDQGFDVIATRGPVAAVIERGPLSRATMRAAGIEAFVSVRPGSGKAASTVVTLGKMSPFVPVDLYAAYRRLNELEGCDGADGWGGSDTVGGSPRSGGTRLPVEVILDALAAFHCG